MRVPWVGALALLALAPGAAGQWVGIVFSMEVTIAGSAAPLEPGGPGATLGLGVIIRSSAPIACAPGTSTLLHLSAARADGLVVRLDPATLEIDLGGIHANGYQARYEAAVFVAAGEGTPEGPREFVVAADLEPIPPGAPCSFPFTWTVPTQASGRVVIAARPGEEEPLDGASSSAGDESESAVPVPWLLLAPAVVGIARARRRR